MQFPDELLRFSNEISRLLKEKTSKNFYILADTTFGSCCVDEIAAQHVNAQLIIHYGHACLTFTRYSHVLYIFPKGYLSVSELVSRFKARFKIEEKYLIFWDVQFDHLMSSLRSNLEEIGYTDILWSEIKKTIHGKESKDKRLNSIYNIPENVLLQINCVYIGYESLSCTNLQMSTSKSFTIYDPKNSTFSLLSSSKLLSRRYYLVQRVKDANRIGIVVGTLGIGIYSF